VCDACAALQVADFDSQLKSFLGLLPKDVALDALKVGGIWVLRHHIIHLVVYWCSQRHPYLTCARPWQKQISKQAPKAPATTKARYFMGRDRLYLAFIEPQGTHMVSVEPIASTRTGLALFIEPRGAHMVSIKKPHPPFQADMDRPEDLLGCRPTQE